MADYAMMLPEITLVIFALALPALDRLLYGKMWLGLISLFALGISGFFVFHFLFPDLIPFMPE